MRFAVLGPLQVERVEGLVQVTGRKERVVLALLLARAGAVASEDELAAALWGATPPRSARRSLQAHVSHLRTALGDQGASGIERIGSGWRCRLEPDCLDSLRFEELAMGASRELARDAFVEAAGLAEAALGLWRGRAFDGFEDLRDCAAESSRLAAIRSAAEDDAAEAALAVGGGAGLVDRLQELVRAEPLRERRWALLMVALYRAGRQADALAAYDKVRRRLRAELGVDPSPELQRRHAQVLAHDPALLAGLHQGGGAPTAAGPPYPALESYDSGDAAAFFGRERVVARIVARLTTQSVVTVAGVSGSGKSSILHAGVLPALAGGAVAGSERWRVVRMTPGRDPERHLAEIGPVDCLVVDQLEELFTQATLESRSAFACALAARVAKGTRLLGAIRSDFWSRCAEVPLLADLVGENAMLVGAMSEDDVRRVVTEPARRAGVHVDPELVEAVVTEVSGRDGVLPLLSTALARAWEGHTGPRVGLADYHRGGGLSHAVGQVAEEVYAGFDEQGQKEARSILLRLAVDGAQGVARQRVPVEYLTETNDGSGVLPSLVQRRLVVVGDEGAEVVHEALFSAWPRLAEWLAEDAAGRRLRTHLTPAARAWEAGGFQSEDLYAGPRLVEALDLRDDEEAPLSRLERHFLDDSAARADAERQDALVRAEREARTSRRLRVLLAGTVALLVSSLVAAGLAVRSRDQAGHAELAADANRLGAQALLEPRPDLSLLLAAQAVALDPTTQTRSNLFGTLLREPRLLRVAHQPSRILGIGLSPDDSTVALCDNRGQLSVRTAGSLATVRTLAAPIGNPCVEPVFLEGGRLVATVQQRLTAGADLVIRRVSDGHVVLRRAAGDGFYTYASPDSHALITAGDAGSHLWVRHGRRWRAIDLGTFRSVTGFGQGGRLFVVGGPSGVSTVVRRASDGSVVRHLAAAGQPVAIAAGSDEVAMADPSGAITLVHALDGRVVGTVSGSGSDTAQVYFADHDRRLVTSNLHGEVTVWDARTGQPVQSIEAGTRVVSTVDSSGRTLWTATDDGTVARWDLTGQRGFGATRRAPTGITAAAYAGGSLVGSSGRRLIALSPGTLRVQSSIAMPRPIENVIADGSDHALALTPAGVRLVAVREGTLTSGVSYPVPGALSAAADPAARELAIANDHGVTVIGADGRRATWPLLRPPGQLAFSPSGNLLAVAETDSSVRIIDPVHGTLTALVPGTHDPVAPGIAFLDQHTLLVGRRDGSVVRWDVPDNRFVGDPYVAVSGSSSRLQVVHGLIAVSSSGTGEALLDAATGLRYGGAQVPVGVEGALAMLSPDGTTLTMLGPNGQALSYPLAPDAWQNRACTVTTAHLTRQEWTRYLPDHPYRPTC